MEWKCITEAPKDGSTVWLCWFDDGDGPFDVVKMKWDSEMKNGLFPDRVGFWVSETSGFTWNPHGDGGPTHFAYSN